MTPQEYNNVCEKIDFILFELGSEFSNNDPLVEQLINLSNEADEYYKDQHIEGYTDIEVSIETQLFVKIIRLARERNLSTNEFIVKCLEAFITAISPDTKKAP